MTYKAFFWFLESFNSKITSVTRNLIGFEFSFIKGKFPLSGGSFYFSLDSLALIDFACFFSDLRTSFLGQIKLLPIEGVGECGRRYTETGMALLLAI